MALQKLWISELLNLITENVPCLIVVLFLLHNALIYIDVKNMDYCCSFFGYNMYLKLLSHCYRMVSNCYLLFMLSLIRVMLNYMYRLRNKICLNYIGRETFIREN